MATDIDLSQSASGGARQDRKTHYLPDYLRLVARKSRAGFDKVHEELTKLYSSEKRMQRRNTQISSPQSTSAHHETIQAKPPTSPTRADRTNQREQKESKRMSFRKQWARSTKTSTLLMSTGSVLPATGSFISYIEELEDESSVPKQRIDAELLKRELNLTRQHSDQTRLIKADNAVNKAHSANQVRKDKPMFTFDEPRVSKSLESIVDSVDRGNETESDQGSDYVNVGDLALQLPTNSGATQDSPESTYDVPRLSIKPQIKPRKHVLKAVDTSDTNHGKDSGLNKTESTTEQLKPSDQISKRNTVENDYLQMDNVNHQRTVNERFSVNNTETVKILEDSLGDSNDYVLPDMCPQQITDQSYTQLEETNNDNIYATIQKHSELNKDMDGKDEVIYANSTSAVYDDFDQLRENNIFKDDAGDIYQVPPTHLNSCVDEAGTFDIVMDSNGEEKEFYDFSVQEVVKCLHTCALPHLASVCEEEQLDGQFFRNFEDKQLLRAPFVLNWFHLAKLRKVISGWRPRH